MATYPGEHVEGRWRFPAIDWNAVISGVAVALATHLLLTLLGQGLGLLNVVGQDVTTMNETARNTMWGGYIWWAISSIISAFLGGWVAGSIASRRGLGRFASGMQGLITWAVWILLLTLLSLFGMRGVTNALTGPMGMASAMNQQQAQQYGQAEDRRSTGSTLAETAREATGMGGPEITTAGDQVRRDLTSGSMLSFFTWLLSALAAILGAAAAANRSYGTHDRTTTTTGTRRTT